MDTSELTDLLPELQGGQEDGSAHRVGACDGWDPQTEETFTWARRALELASTEAADSAKPERSASWDSHTRCAEKPGTSPEQ